MSCRRFEGKVVVVTGAASGIGQATALRVGAEGGAVVCADVAAEGAMATAEAIASAGGRALGVACDVADEAQVAALFDAALEAFGGSLHALCHIAGVLRFDHTHELALEAWERVLRVNLTGTFLVNRAAIPHLLKTKGAIVNMASTSAHGGHPWTSAYTASKGGVLAFTRGLAVEYGKQGLRANTVSPGAVTTPIHRQFRLPSGADPKLLTRITQQDAYRGPETVAGVICMLASDDGIHVNGADLRIDAGMLA